MPKSTTPTPITNARNYKPPVEPVKLPAYVFINLLDDEYGGMYLADNWSSPLSHRQIRKLIHQLELGYRRLTEETITKWQEEAEEAWRGRQ